MLQRLHVKDGQSPDDARRRFDVQLGVDASWAVPGRRMRAPQPREAGAPWWWRGAEDASQSFLHAMGVRLDG